VPDHAPIVDVRTRDAIVQTQEEEAWAAINTLLGEALLDVERTFLNVVDHSVAARAFQRSVSQECIEDYLAAWAVLDRAHLRMLQFLSTTHGRLAVSAR
jgi:hypothetical protein